MQHLLHGRGPEAAALVSAMEDNPRSHLCAALWARTMGEQAALTAALTALLDAPDAEVSVGVEIAVGSVVWDVPSPKGFRICRLEAISLLRRLCDRAPSESVVLRLSSQLSLAGQPLEGQRRLAVFFDAHPEAVEVGRALCTYLLQHRDPQAAEEVARRLVVAGDEDSLDLLARAAVSAGVADARTWVLAAMERSPAGWRAAAERLVALGDLTEAERVSTDADEPEYVLFQARFLLWRGQVDEARALAEAFGEPGHPECALILGAAAVLQGRWTEAIAHLDVALGQARRRRGHPGESRWLTVDELLTWRSQAYLAGGYPKRAKRDASEAMTAAYDFNVSALLARTLSCTFEAMEPSSAIDPELWRRLDQHLGHVVPDREALQRGTAGDVRAQLTAAQEALAGNRSCLSTHRLEDGRLARIRPMHTRHACRKMQLLYRTRAFADIDAAFEAMAASLPGDPIVHTYWGELLVWEGQYARAAERFSHALSISTMTTWAWIGLGATQMLQGSPTDALETFASGVQAVGYEGPTLYVYRGEALRLLGQLPMARRQLDTALRSKRSRVSAWVNRALLADAMGDRASAVRFATELRTQCPRFWRDAEEHAGHGDVVAVLEAGLALMRGNRSSTLLSYTVGEERRFIPWRARVHPGAMFR